MTSEKLKQSLGSSVSMLISERRRLEDEVLRMERQKMAEMSDDDLVRAMAQQVAADERKLAEKRALLAKAEQQRQVLARDNAAAKEAARQAELDAAKQALRSEVAAYMSDYTELVRSLRNAATGIASLQARMREIGSWCSHLNPSGKSPMITDAPAYEQRLAMLVVHHMRRVAGRRERLGNMQWPSFADAEHPIGHDHVEIERDRMQRHVVDAFARVEG